MTTKRTTVTVHYDKLNTQTRKNKAIACGKELEILVNSPEFKKEILAMGNYWRQGEVSKYKNASVESIYSLIMSGKEETSAEMDNDLDIYIDDYTTWKNVVGYMIPGRRTIFVNTRYFDNMSKEKVVSNMLHEYTHTLGFRHSGPNIRRSIPYYMNEVVTKLYPIVIKGEEIPSVIIPKYKTTCYRSWRSLWFKRCYRVRVD